MIVGDPSPKHWNRVRRYASWMREVHVEEWSTLENDAFLKLRLNSPPGGWFPALQRLSLYITEPNLPHANLFFSQHLKELYIRLPWYWRIYGIPPDILPVIASTISTLPTSSLQLLVVRTRDPRVPWEYFKDSFSSVILRCGPSFMEYISPVPLSDAAVNHLLQLPLLRAWSTHDPPPCCSTSSFPLAFPPLEELTLREGAIHGWVSLSKRLESGVSTTQAVTLLSKMKGSLRSLNVETLPGFIIDTSFTSLVQIFRNLVNLDVAADCQDEEGKEVEGQCTFKLNNDDVVGLSMTLSQLESLVLGHPCSRNVCITTVACLLPISVHCPRLRKLEIHFNTTNVIEDFKNISEDPRFQELRLLPKCPLTYLNVHRTPLTLDESGFETTANGMTDIFPSLRACCGLEYIWNRLSRRITGLQRV